MFLDKFKTYANDIGIKYLEDESLSKHTSFRIGGPADIFAEPENIEQIKRIIKFSNENDVPLFVLGNGSNMLINDDGISGIILHLGNLFSGIELFDDVKIKCFSGISLSQLCNFAYEHELKGLEFSYGIPGTLGGAIYMNAGAFGGEIKDVIESVSFLDSDGFEKTMSNDELDFSYRHSFFSNKNFVITSATIVLEKGNKEIIKSKMDEILGRRKEKQPLEFPSAGSTFKRPEGAFAAALIEQCGLKGLNVGNAEVSEKHAGFIVNKGNATYLDVISLIEKVKKIVKDKTGYILEPEVEIIDKR